MTCAREGITFTLSEACAIVGVRVTPSIGSTMIGSAASTLAIRSTAPAGSSGSPPRRAINASATSVSSNEDWAAASFSSTAPSFNRALSPVLGMEA